MKIKHMELNANNDTAPVNSIGLNTPDGVKYLSGESGSLTFGGEAIGGGGIQIVTLDTETMTCSHSASEIIAMMQTVPVFIYAGGGYYLPITEDGIVLISATVTFEAIIICNTFTIGEDKSVTYASVAVQGSDNI